MKLYESGENYLETILMLKEEHKIVRSIDVANHLGVTKPSVSRAMSILKKASYITINSLGGIELTEAGLNRAKKILERHLTLTRFLREHLGVSDEHAEMDACRIEHVISDETFKKMKEHIEE